MFNFFNKYFIHNNMLFTKMFFCLFIYSILNYVVFQDVNEVTVDIKPLILQVQTCSTYFFHLARLPVCQPFISDISSHVSHISIVDCLRNIRQWTTVLPNLYTIFKTDSSLVSNELNVLRVECFENLKNLLDSILLTIVKFRERIVVWSYFDNNQVSFNLFMSISITIQCLANLLVESRDPIKPKYIHSLIVVLLAHSRPSLLLTNQGLDLLGYGCFDNHRRITKYLVYLFYMLLLNLNRSVSPVSINSEISNLIMNKLVNNWNVLGNLISQANCRKKEQDQEAEDFQIDCQLLIGQLSCQCLILDLGSGKFKTEYPKNSWNLIILATGLGLFAQHLVMYDLDMSIGDDRRPVVPLNVKSCLTFWKIFTHGLDLSNQLNFTNMIFRLTESLKVQTQLWFQDLYHLKILESGIQLTNSIEQVNENLNNLLLFIFH